MKNSRLSVLLSLSGVMLLWPFVFTKSVSSRIESEDNSSPWTGQGEERPHVEKRSTQSCGSAYETYCMNNGECMLLVDINERHCKCESGFHGSRCENMDLVKNLPMGEEQIILTLFCVSLLMIGLSGALYFCCKWYKKNRFPRTPKQQGYRGVQCDSSSIWVNTNLEQCLKNNSTV